MHTELLSDGVMDLVEAGVVTGVAKQLNRTKAVGTFVLGDPPPVRLPRREHRRRAVARQTTSTTLAASLRRTGSCRSTRRSPSISSVSAPARPSAATTTSSGGQADFARGAMYSAGGQGFVVLASTAKDDIISKIVSRLAPGDVVTTLKNTVDKVVTEWGVAELRGRSLRERARSLIAIANPAHRERLGAEAKRFGYLKAS